MTASLRDLSRAARQTALAGGLALLCGAAHGEPAGDALGRATYTNCAACHGVRGQGGYGPAFAGGANLQDADYVIARILIGAPKMPAFQGHLSDAEIAAVVNYLRNSWGAKAAPVTAGDVGRVSAQFKDESAPAR